MHKHRALGREDGSNVSEPVGPTSVSLWAQLQPCGLVRPRVQSHPCHGGPTSAGLKETQCQREVAGMEGHRRREASGFAAVVLWRQLSLMTSAMIKTGSTERPGPSPPDFSLP